MNPNIHGRHVWLGDGENVADVGGAVVVFDYPALTSSIFTQESVLLQPFTVELQPRFGHKALDL